LCAFVRIALHANRLRPAVGVDGRVLRRDQGCPQPRA
jgi:hypothetical protein